MSVTADVPAEFGAGGTGSVRLTFRLDDPAEQFERGVLFLNVVANRPAQGYPQAAHRVFSGASEEPGVFRRVLSAEELRAGLVTVLQFDVRPRAPLGEYVLVVQLFAGDEVNPHRVRADKKLGQANFPFRLVAIQ